ncbi:dTDP-4-amino-4,6-dideoxy-D-glucose transaminase [Rhodocyclaceae bacterium]|nr:dTDP-4-amino-4,6-dideoxy-D-glucose transaminase [Rhodocyclaceae bacterium]
MNDSRIYVTRPDLPPLEEFLPLLREIWESRTLTNGGPFHQQLEEALCEHLGIGHLSLFANGTLALITALQALGIRGEVVTTPYSFVATSHALMWNGIRPVFADIDANSLNLDPARIEAAIGPETTAILPVHCYGRPCATDAIADIADRHGLKVLYDAAAAFGVRDAGGSVLRHGDLSVLSFHATKVFNTFEGGAIVSPDAATKLRIDQLKNFGYVDEVTVVAAGINGKMSEFNAALGLLQLPRVAQAIARRGEIDALYRSRLASVDSIRCLPAADGVAANHAYFPILVEATYPLGRDGLYVRLKAAGFHARRYFFPLISDFPMYRHYRSARPENLPVAAAVAGKVLCLPIYPELDDATVAAICRLIATP